MVRKRKERVDGLKSTGTEIKNKRKKQSKEE
jgi:hypothetical protein